MSASACRAKAMLDTADTSSRPSSRAAVELGGHPVGEGQRRVARPLQAVVDRVHVERRDAPDAQPPHRRTASRPTAAASAAGSDRSSAGTRQSVAPKATAIWQAAGPRRRQWGRTATPSGRARRQMAMTVRSSTPQEPGRSAVPSAGTGQTARRSPVSAASSASVGQPRGHLLHVAAGAVGERRLAGTALAVGRAVLRHGALLVAVHQPAVRGVVAAVGDRRAGVERRGAGRGERVAGGAAGRRCARAGRSRVAVHDAVGDLAQGRDVGPAGGPLDLDRPARGRHERQGALARQVAGPGGRRAGRRGPRGRGPGRPRPPAGAASARAAAPGSPAG